MIGTDCTNKPMNFTESDGSPSGFDVELIYRLAATFNMAVEIRVMPYLDLFTAVETGLDMRCISDEHVEGNGFTGSMLGVNCCDCQGDGTEARFTLLDYREVD